MWLGEDLLWLGRGRNAQMSVLQPISRHAELRVIYRPSFQGTQPLIETLSQRLMITGENKRWNCLLAGLGDSDDGETVRGASAFRFGEVLRRLQLLHSFAVRTVTRIRPDGCFTEIRRR